MAGFACKYCCYNLYCDDWEKRKNCSEFRLNWDALSEADRESIRNVSTEKDSDEYY